MPETGGPFDAVYLALAVAAIIVLARLLRSRLSAG